MDNPTSRIEHKITWIVVCLAVIGLVVLGYRVVSGDMKDRLPVSIGAKTFYADVARTDIERQQGLGGTTELPESEALLMVFDSDDKWSIGMKDMNYSIDIVWISKDKRVVDSVQHARPDSYPDQRYVPRHEARYVLELADGAIQQYAIRRGSKVKFNIGEVTQSEWLLGLWLVLWLVFWHWRRILAGVVLAR